MLLNRERADAVMDKHRLRGLVAKENINIYYLSDYWESMTDGGWPFLDYAVLPRAENAPASLVLPTIKLDRLSETPTWMPNVVAFSDYSGREAGAARRNTFPDEPPAAPWTGWRLRPGARLTPAEQGWLDRATVHADRLAATPAWALRRALKDAGLTNGRIGTDDPRVLQWMKEMGLDDIEIVDATNAFREIRMIKTPDEVALMRKAAQINEQATMTATRALEDGVAWEEIENVFHAAHARQGGRNGHIVGNLGGFRHGRVARGVPMFVDAIGTYRHYFGDFGRSVVVGEPDAELRRRAKAMQAGWEVAIGLLRPGVRRSHLIAKTIEAVQKAGLPEFFYVSPHSIGLEHTDSPLPYGREVHGEASDYVFEENMVINIDMPFTEWGWGSMHLEDTLLVTRSGYEPLTSMQNELVVVGG
jgi:Xaa-Pro aminopeptidase